MSAVGPQAAAPDVAVVGFGYIGSVIAAVLAARGLCVVGIDTNAEMIAALNQGKCPIPEPDLEDLVAAVAARFDADIAEDDGARETVTFKLPRVLTA